MDKIESLIDEQLFQESFYDDSVLPKAKLYLYEGSYQFNVIEIDNKSVKYVKELALAELKKQYDYRSTKETLWADIAAPNSEYGGRYDSIGIQHRVKFVPK